MLFYSPHLCHITQYYVVPSAFKTVTEIQIHLNMKYVLRGINNEERAVLINDEKRSVQIENRQG